MNAPSDRPAPSFEAPGAATVESSNMLVTGGAGFIGSNFIRYIFAKTGFKGRLINLDALTYAGNPKSLADIDQESGGTRYFFERGDIRVSDVIEKIFDKYDINMVVHFAAESHVDRSITGPRAFVETNITGTFNLLEVARQYWAGRHDVRFHHVSTDEVYGSLGETGYFYETTPYDPRSPYSASKAASDHLVRSYLHTFNVPFTLSNCSNNYGPYQFPEKLIPLVLLNALEGKPLPIYGDGKNVRDWLYVEDHCHAIWRVLTCGATGETYNVGGQCEKQNIEIVKDICGILEELRPAKDNQAMAGKGGYESLITYVKDRPGHDRRYAIDCAKIMNDLNWSQGHDFTSGIRQTIAWYLDNSDWVDSVVSGEYKDWIENNYGDRGVTDPLL